MIYDSTITSVNESDIMELLENTENRFEDETMAEATAIVVGEQEVNWTRFMQGVGLSELATIMEGEQVIYEGARFDKFIAKAKGFFQMILNKLAELTKAFMAKVDQLFKTNAGFIKKYKSTLLKLDFSKLDIEYNGYKFNENRFKKDFNPYSKGLGKTKSIDFSNAKEASRITGVNKDTYSREAAEDSFFSESMGDGTFGDKLNKWFYGEGKTTIKIGSSEISDAIKIVEGTKELREEARKSYKNASKEVKDIIKKLKDSEKKFSGNLGSGEGETDAKNSTIISSAFKVLLDYWKSFGGCCTQMHGAYLTAIGKRNRQARAICVKALNASGKAKGKEDRKEIKARTEGFVDTEDFLAAVDFI